MRTGNLEFRVASYIILIVIMATLWYRASHYIFALWFLSIFYLLLFFLT